MNKYNTESKECQTAIHIIEEVIEPLLLEMTRDDYDMEDGINGELYHNTETKIIDIISKYL